MLKNFTSSLINKDGIWYSEETSKISYPKEGNEYYFHIENNSFWFKHRNECIKAAVNNYPPVDNTIYDVGGGNGFVSKGLSECGYNTVLVEPGIYGVRNAQKRGLENLICSTFQDAKFEESSLGGVGLFDVLEHIEDDVVFLKEIYLSLKKQGRLYICVPAFMSLWSDEDIEVGHYRRYKLNNLVKKLNSVGFSIDYKTFFFSFLPVPIFLFRTLPYILGYHRRLISTENQHTKSASLIDQIFYPEIGLIKKKKKILYGGSILIVAQKR